MSGTSSAFDVVLQDDFSQGYKYENWGSPFHGGTYWNGAFEWNRDDVAVRDGTMQVTVTRHADGHWTTGGFNSFKAGKDITYGRIQFDGKVEESVGTMGVFLTWATKDDDWPAQGEIDILETPYQDVMHTTHWEDGNGNHQYNSVRNQSYDETQWNHYDLLWLPDRLTLKVNGKVVADWTDPAEIPDVAHGIGAMGMVASPNDGWMGPPPDGSTPAVTTIYMDNVVMSQWNGQPVTDEPSAPTPVPLPTPVPAPSTPVELSAGEGPDSLVLKISQDAYQGSAQYTVSVDGKQVGGTFTAGATRASGKSDTLTLKGDWAAGEHKVEVKFLNDAWGGTAATDRNLYVDGAAYNGKAVDGAAQAIESDWQPGGFSFTEAPPVVVVEPPPPATAGSGPDSLVLRISQDAYQGNAQYTVSVDGKQIGGTFTAYSLHSSGVSDTLTLKGDWGPGAHRVEVKFLNDAWGGTAATDRNLHVDGAAYNGKAVDGAAATFFVAGAKSFSFAEAAAPAPVAKAGTDGADLFDATEATSVFTGKGGRDLFVFEAGDGPATVTDFQSGTDKLVFIGLDREDVTTEAAASGPPGLVVGYGDEGSVFLAGVAALAAKDMVFA